VGAKCSILASIIVRLIDETEGSLWRQNMQLHHYLGFSGITGNYLLYVATINNRWCALIGWCAASLKIKARDDWIGWDNLAKHYRLKMIVNNFRFLILPEFRVKNAASKILALNLKRLSKDWYDAFGYNIILAETFIDPQKFGGTCYLASGWNYLGDTKGYSRTSQGYRRNSKPKKIFIKELTKNSRITLRNPYFPTVGGYEVPMIDFSALPIEGDNGLVNALCGLNDYRNRQGRRHSKIFLLAIITGALLSGAQNYDEIVAWSKKLTETQSRRLRSRDGKLPSKITLNRDFRRA